VNVEFLPEIVLSIAQLRAMNSVLREIVEGIARCPNVALVRIWLTGPGDLCAQCHFRSECPNQERCLHLAASAGSSRHGDRTLSGLNGAFRRFPLGVRTIGSIAQNGQGVLISNLKANQSWIAVPKWIETEGVRSFAGQPLVFGGETLGVLGLFDRGQLTTREFAWLRTFADHAAVAIANARALEEIKRLRRQLQQENDYLREEVKQVWDFGEIVGRSVALKKVLRQTELVAATNATALILGESGTGKELIARAIHERSSRRKHPLIKVNCSAIPETLFESEMFGHVRGAFTGALKDRVGRFHLADGGTLFLDEVAEIPLALQAKLLRAVQEQQFERLGEDRTRTVNVRVLAATNRDLKQEVQAGRFREDLFYRLSVFPIQVPPLRSRKEDIPLLAMHFLKSAATKLGIKPGRLIATDFDQLIAYDWPGNVRELQNMMERALILAQGGRLVFDVLNAASSAPISTNHKTGSHDQPLITRAELRRREQENIRAALTQSRGRVFGPDGAAKLLGMKPTTLASRIKALGLREHQKLASI
jgi:transcriptional regulator with GAF, ATPase, and Fis domain